MQSFDLVTVLNDGDTYSSVEGSFIAAVPDEVFENDDVENFLKEGDYRKLPLGTVKDENTIVDFFGIFFPQMQITKDERGQIVIHTGVFA